MNLIPEQRATDSRAFALPIVISILAGVLLAIFFGNIVGSENFFILMLIGLAAAGSLWVVFGQKVWWVPLFFFVALGGNFYFGFKIYLHEVAVLFALAPLIFVFCLTSGRVRYRATGYEKPVFLLCLYICIHLLACLIWNKVNGLGGTGSVVRRYADALWPIVILLPVLLYADLKFLRWALRLMLLGAAIRVGIGLTAVFSGREEMIYIPLINYLPPGGGAAGDLRGAGSALTGAALVFFCLSRSLFVRAAMAPLMLVGAYSTFLGGSRLALVGLAGTFFLALMIYRKWVAMLGLAAISLVAIILVNASPETLYGLPESARRAVSGFIINDATSEALGETSQSNLWHERLAREGWNSWTENVGTILFGRGVRPFEEGAWYVFGTNDLMFEARVEQAIQTSRFEKGLWDTLCTFGVVGFALFCICIFRICSGLFPILLKRRISSPPLGLAFLAVSGCLTWLLLCWIGGSFPSYPILLGFVAMAALREEERGKVERPLVPLPEKEELVLLRSPLRRGR